MEEEFEKVFSVTDVKAECFKVLHHYKYWFCFIFFLGMIFNTYIGLLFILQNSVGMCIYKNYSNLCDTELILVLRIVF